MSKVKGDIASERALLSCIAQYGPAAMTDIDSLIDTSCFTVDINQSIFKCLETSLQSSSHVDIPSFYAAANKLGLYEILSETKKAQLIQTIFDMPVKQENTRKFAIKLKKIKIAKDLQYKLEMAHASLGDISGDEPIDEILNIPEEIIYDYTNTIAKNSDDAPTLMFADIEEHIEFLKENRCEIVGLPSGLNLYDLSIGGGQRKGSVNIIASRPGVGKTTFAKQVAVHVAKNLNIPVLMFDTEMNKEDQINRSLAGESHVKIKTIETGQFGDTNEDDIKVLEAGRVLKNIPYYYKNIAGRPFEEAKSLMRRWVVQTVGLDENGNTNNCLIIYDYFKLMDDSNLKDVKEYQALGFQLMKLTDFCNEFQVPCLAFAQSNRDGIDKEDTSVIADSDRLLRFAGSIALFKRKTKDEIVEDGPQYGNRKILILKTRYSSGLPMGDWININMHDEYSYIEEVGLASAMKKQKNAGGDHGFDNEDNEDDYDDDGVLEEENISL